MERSGSTLVPINWVIFALKQITKVAKHGINRKYFCQLLYQMAQNLWRYLPLWKNLPKWGDNSYPRKIMDCRQHALVTLATKTLVILFVTRNSKGASADIQVWKTEKKKMMNEYVSYLTNIRSWKIRLSRRFSSL